MKKHIGYSIVEVLIALCVLGVVVPTSLDALGNVFMMGLKIHEKVCVISAAEWWFTSLPLTVSRSDIAAAPREDDSGRVRFEWESEELGNDAIRVTLRATGKFSHTPFTISRIY